MASTFADQSFDVVVVGSGVGGLVAALAAARAGNSVLVLEAAKQFGGFINPFRRGKYRFDPGVHYIGECGPGQAMTRVLAAVGLGDRVSFREIGPDVIDRVLFPGYEIAMPRGLDAYRDRLVRDFPHERTGIDRFFDLLRQFRGAMRALLQGPMAGSGSSSSRSTGLLEAASHVPFLLQYGHATFAEVIDPLVKDPLLRAVLAAQSGDYGLPPKRASALIGLALLDHYLHGAYFPRGGAGALRDALVDSIEQHGGQLFRNTPVDRILLKNGRVAGVRTRAGEEVRATTVISNADAAHTYLSLIGEENLPFLTRRRAKKTRQSVASICIFLGTDLDLSRSGMTDANIWSYSTTDFDRYYEPIYRGELPDLDFLFLSSPSLKDPGSPGGPPPGNDSLEIVTLAPYEPFARWDGKKSMRRGDDYEAFKQSLFDRYMTTIEGILPGLRGHILVSEIATPITNITYATVPRGAIYGPEATPDQMGPFRYTTQGAFDGLYLCGSSTLGGGIVPAAASGLQAGRAAASWARAHRPAQLPVPAAP